MATGKTDALDHVRIQRALRQKIGATDFGASSSNTSMNSRPIVLRFVSGSVTPSSAPRNKSDGVPMHQLDVEAIAERRYHLIGLVVPEQSVIDENAG